MLIQLGKHCTDVEVSICLDLGSLEAGLNGQSSLQEVEGSSHLANASVVTSHVIEGHCLAKLVILA